MEISWAVSNVLEAVVEEEEEEDHDDDEVEPVKLDVETVELNLCRSNEDITQVKLRRTDFSIPMTPYTNNGFVFLLTTKHLIFIGKT